jgi:BolA-like protein 1
LKKQTIPNQTDKPKPNKNTHLYISSGMSGNTAADIQKVDAQFIQRAKISQSLTPGRNNGFLNMLRVMKQKAMELDMAAREQEKEAEKKKVSTTTTTTVNANTDSNSATTTTTGVVLSAIENDPTKGPKYNAICQALSVLQPTVLNLMDNSHQHAGHAGNDMDGESHFELEIVAAAFEGLSLVKRHKLIYMVLGDIMPQIHALQIRSLTPDELKRSSTSS